MLNNFLGNIVFLPSLMSHGVVDRSCVGDLFDGFRALRFSPRTALRIPGNRSPRFRL
jgi:hypothetical protein